MVRKIDLSKPLSDDDRQYLVDRDRWRDLATADGHDDPRQARRDAEQGLRPTQVSSTVLTPTSPALPPRRQDPGDGSTEVNDQEPVDYNTWTFEDLKAELDDRKAEAIEAGMPEEEAAKRFSKGGKQKDLVARLEADDDQPYEQSQQ